MAVHTRSTIGAPAAAPEPEPGDLMDVVRSHGSVIRSERQAQTAKVEPFLEWSQRIPTVRGTPLDFERFPFQPAIYETFGDTEIREAEAMKGVQVGMSELMTRLVLWLPDTRPTKSLYVFPAQKQMWDYSDTRVSPLYEQSTYLQTRAQLGQGWTWNKGLKRIGSGHAYFRGSESKRDLIAVDADLVGMDEYDQLHPPNIPQAEKRVSGSLIGMIRRIGVPSDPEYGIAKRYKASDMRQWFVKCGACNEWQPITFKDNVRWEEQIGGIVTAARRVCKHCERDLDVTKGEWVAEHPERARPGFHVHRLLVPNTNLISIVEASKLRDPILVQAFWNEDLGLPYSDKEGGLDRATIAAAISAGTSWNEGEPMEMTHAYRGPGLVTMGVDVASVRSLNYRISLHLDPLTEPGHRKRLLAVGTAESFDEIVELMNRFNVDFAVIDHEPEYRLAAGVADRFPGRVYLGHYSSQMKDVLKVDTEARTVAAQRVPALDATAAVMRAQRNLLTEDIPPQYVEHMVALRRRVTKDEYDRQTIEWVSVGPDDYFHAEVYDLLATEVAKVRIEVEAMETLTQEVVSLEQQLEYRRARLSDPDDMEYRPGGISGGYRPGMGEPPG